MFEFQNVSLRLGEKQILREVSFSLAPHRLAVLVGPNGAGKSSLLACVNQQYLYRGQIRLEERDLAQLTPKERAKAIALLPQQLQAPHLTAWDMAAFGRGPYLDFTGRLTREDKQAVEQALRSANAWELAERYVDTLSGGERQRVALAMALAQNTPIILLDEPTAHMDAAYEAALLRQLKQWKDEKQKTVLVILHDLTLAVEYADDLIVLAEGKIRFAGTKEDCLEQAVLEDTFALRRYDAGDKVFFAAR